MAKDIEGNDVVVGCKVKVLNINETVWEYLPEDEKSDLKSMFGDVLEVYEVSDNFASVEKWWQEGNGRGRCHSLSLGQEEMLLVK
ncbi:hypothetical protein [Thioflavicoccus mobilis]|uniref:hypothetical protein n=1 Tax=Thioflavicoccus mobilis TaxID=80679 RepID=UPI0012FBC690|nr:hypothetical protein [Thioflavicoccus mobilis]